MLCLLASCPPLAVFAYLGTFARLIYDDYCIFGTGLDLGPWENMLYWRATWNGSYSYYFLHGLIAPVGAAAVRILPALIIILWLFGLILLAYRALSRAGVEKHRIIVALMFAGALLSATVNAIFWEQVIFWYAASVPYTLTLAILTIYAGLMWELVRRDDAKIPPKLPMAAGAFICFLNAGLAAFHMVIQLGIFTLAIPAAFAFVPKRSRRPTIIVLGSGWLATVASLVAQLTAPGVALRANAIAEKWGVPDRTITTLLFRTVKELLYAAWEPESLAGIIFLLALGMLLALKLRFRDQTLIGIPFRFSRAPFLLGIGVQLLFIPLLWAHTSDTPQLFGRFSSGYATVIAANVILILIFALLAIAVHRVNSLLSRHDGSWLIYPGSTLLIVAILFAMTQLGSIHWRASTYIFFTLQLMILVLAWQLARPLPSAQSRRFALLAAWAYVSTWAINAPVVFATAYTLPIVHERVLSYLYFSLILNGLIWGLFLGYAIRRYKLSTRLERYGLRFLQSLCLILISVIGIGMAMGQLRHAPQLSLYADEWDSRHEYIITRLAEGEQDVIEVKPLSMNLREFMKHNADALPCSTEYYHVETVIVDNT